MTKTIQEEALEFHLKNHGKIETKLRTQLETKHDLSLAYTPGVATVSSHLSKNPKETNDYTWRGRCVAVISDGSAVLGLGNIGPEGAYPVMEGKCALFKRFAGLDAVPIVLNTQDPDEIIKTVEAIAPSFGAINLEDISAPKCFYIEESLKKSLNIPVIHDDQWGTSVVVLAGVINAFKVAGKNVKSAKVVVNGAGAAGSAVIKILHNYGIAEILACDSEGIIYKNRVSIKPEKLKIAEITNPKNQKGSLSHAVIGADILIGVSKARLFTKEMIETMSEKSIVFALANPTPEIMPIEAREAGAFIVSTGRSDFPNQVNNALAFPGIFKGALENKINFVNIEMLTKAGEAIANLIELPTKDKIIPDIFDDRVVPAIVSCM